jgi:hypothetical protein
VQFAYAIGVAKPVSIAPRLTPSARPVFEAGTLIAITMHGIVIVCIFGVGRPA